MHLAILITLIAATHGGQAIEFEPAGDQAYTADLIAEGYVNGSMDTRRLMTVDGCTLERDAAYTYSLMLEAAAQDGVRLRHEDCYRSYQRQDAAYNRRCPWEDIPIFGKDAETGEEVQVGTKRMRVCTGPPTAPAGKSNHGWGRAIDFRNQRGVLSCTSSEFHWLKENGHRFGWVHPPWAACGKATAEPWHWEYAGVTTPILLRLAPVETNLNALE